MAVNDELETGSLLIFETGEYSDFNWHGPVRVVRAFSKSAVAQLFRDQFVPAPSYEGEPETNWAKAPSEQNFLPWLVTNGYVEDVPAHSWHIGSYGSFDPD